jgi:hypothetical protein
MNAIRRLCMHQRNANAFQEAERDKALFSIVKSIVLERESRASKDFPSIGKIKSVVLEVRSSLGFAPCKPHFESVYTNRIFVKGECGIGLPSKLERRAEATRNAETAPVTASVLRQFQ